MLHITLIFSKGNVGKCVFSWEWVFYVLTQRCCHVVLSGDLNEKLEM